MQKRKLREVGTIISGATPKTTDSTNFGGDIPWITPADLSGYTEKYIAGGARNLTEKGYNSCSTQLIPANSVVFSSRAPIGYVAIAKNPLCTNQGFKSVIPDDGLDSEFLYYQLLYLRDSIREMGTGTTFKEISGKRFGEIDIAVPSIYEQRRIVARIEELFSQLDDAEATLQKTKAQLSVFRQAVLKETFDSVKTSSYHPLRTVIVGTPQNGLYKPKSDYCDNGTPILRIDGFYDGSISSDYSYKRVNLSTEEGERYRLEIGDLVVNRVNSMPYLGKCALVRSLIEPTIFESNMMRIKLNTNMVDGDWITYYLSSHAGKRELTKNAKQAINQASINQTDVGNALVPIPSIYDQNRLVKMIESRLSVCDSIKQTVDMALQRAIAMRHSILKKIFGGNHE